MSIEPSRNLFALAMRHGREVATRDSHRTKRVLSQLSGHLLNDIGYAVVSGRIVAR